ncbi:putative dolichyl-phosphate-mannose--protein mannosyltransferase [Halomicronema hongdechloris C2206]|uniref:Polyprenol-phosphate-mannose--protein mannosyltransferase n=1 Tax=Halomicronema hongdechloris C2206 TaxID=1641165 RepID=A0A1Z3HKM1_9CYAN|nr:phospholipid carrier-dependent glycosyltransferase [Halomicronema hongdechloris]ASC70843.1 putative dolichyl-phosphate-mannose--protein mannosyltransferase [Halomicronema hongdechloris C2206]
MIAFWHRLIRQWKLLTQHPLALGIGLFWGLALGLRLWQLGRFNTLVFDEVYYVQFAVDYLHQTPSFDAHPPLGKYLIALGIWLAQQVPLAGLPSNGETGLALSPISYRWLNAVTGSLLVPVVAGLAYGLARPCSQAGRTTITLVAAGLMAVEGFSLVESRYGLINIYWLLLGLLGQALWLQSPRLPWRLGAGLALGAAMAVKWNGAGFWLALVLLAGIGHWPRLREQVPPTLRGVPWRQGILSLGLVPLATYGLLWLPHLHLAQTNLLSIHWQIWQTHQQIGGVSHPYCSAWYTWPLLLRPIAYVYQRRPLSGNLSEVIYDVHGLGNPILWWLSTAAILVLLAKVLSRWRHWGARPGDGIAPFLLVNYATNWLPWLLVSRCTFLYHYFGSLVVSLMALAWLISGWLQGRHRLAAWLLLGAIAVAFLFWLPLYLGWPLTPAAWQRRFWLPSWI